MKQHPIGDIKNSNSEFSDFVVGKLIHSANTELSFGADDEHTNFTIFFYRSKPLNKFQIWMYKVCFGIRARNIRKD